MRSAKEAIAYMKAIHQLVRYLDICDGNMQEGSFRCDANVSVRPVGRHEFGTRAEIKNLNSFRFVERAIRSRWSGRSTSSSRAARWCRKRACTTRTRTRPVRCAARKRRTTTATSRIPTCCRWKSARGEIEAVRADLPELPRRQARPLHRASTACPTTTPVCSRAGRAVADYFETVRRRTGGQEAGCQLGHGRARRRPQQGRPGHRRQPG